MNFWNQHDLQVMELMDKISLLKEEFDIKHGKDIDNYNQKFNRFLDEKLKKEANLILKRQVFMTTFSLINQNRNI